VNSYGAGGNQLMSWCKNNGVDFVFGLARNQRLVTSRSEWLIGRSLLAN
jgi:hypothetical protein